MFLSQAALTQASDKQALLEIRVAGRLAMIPARDVVGGWLLTGPAGSDRSGDDDCLNPGILCTGYWVMRPWRFAHEVE